MGKERAAGSPMYTSRESWNTQITPPGCRPIFSNSSALGISRVTSRIGTLKEVAPGSFRELPAGDVAQASLLNTLIWMIAR